LRTPSSAPRPSAPAAAQASGSVRAPPYSAMNWPPTSAPWCAGGPKSRTQPSDMAPRAATVGPHADAAAATVSNASGRRSPGFTSERLAGVALRIAHRGPAEAGIDEAVDDRPGADGRRLVH